MSALVSLCFGHYYVKEGNHVLLGAETAQALPSSQLYYAFIRGACKQYGLHWFGNASCFNRWGYKNYVPDTTTPDGEGYSRCGPTLGTSLSLLRRLIYTHILYNSVAVGFELGYLTTHKEFAVAGFDATDHEQTPLHLSPIGAIQAEAARFLDRNGQPGVMHCPVALLLNHFAGWAPPRHLYTSAVFRVWGAMPYGAGDYLTHAVLGQIYPGYEDASYYHDERGFLSPTPYGDIADAVLSDIPLWVLRQYGLVIVAGELDADLELRDKLTAFVTQGGELVVTAANAARLWPGWHIAEPVKLPAGSKITCSDGRQWVEPNAFSLCPIQPPEKAEVWARCGELPAVVRVPLGEGNVCLLLSPFGLNDEPLTEGDPYPAGDPVDKPLASPFLLAEHVRAALDDCLRRQQLFSVGNGLGFVACRKSEGQYTLGVFNNGLSARPMEIAFRAGEIFNVEELAIKDQVVKDAPGYWPTDFQGNDGGASDEQNTAGGDTRIFRVRVREQRLTVLPPPSPPPRPSGRMLAICGAGELKEAILAMPTFFQHFDGVKVDWSYLHARDIEQLRREAGWLARQKLRIAVDFSSGLNLYPGLTLLDTLEFRYEESVAAIDGVLDKMPALGASAAIISLHRLPENHCPRQRGEERFRACVGALCDRAAERDITLMLQHHPSKHRPGAAATVEFIAALGRGNLSFALDLAHVLQCGEGLAETLALAADRLGAVLLSAPVTDLFGQPYDAHAPLHTADADLSPLAALTVPQILDARYTSWDEVYQDLRALAWTQCPCRSAPSP
jgi:hydroxypyruvate isomerase